MFRRRHKEEEIQTDARLAALVARWRGVEPAADFEQAVWRRIRAEAVAVPGRAGVVGWLALPDWRMILAPGTMPAVAIVAVFLLAGGWFGSMAGNAEAVRHAPVQPLLAANTIAGAYASLATGGPQ
jgi:hypothetical protein